MTNPNNEPKPTRKLITLSIQDDDGTWWDISDMIPFFEEIPISRDNEEEREIDQ